MDVEAIAKRIAIDHGVNVLEKDVIETLEKLKAANKDKTTGAGQAPVTAQTPEVSPITSASAPPAPVPAGNGAASAPLQTVPAPLQTVPAPLQAGSAPLNPTPAPQQTIPAPVKTSSEQPKTGSEQPSNLKIPAGVKPLPIVLIDDLIMQNYSREGIEAILKENKLPPYRNLISERMKLVKPAIRGASNGAGNTQPLMGTGAAPLSTGAAPLSTGAAPLTRGAELANRLATDTQNVSSIKTSENTGNSGISSENVVAPLPAPQETVPAPLSTGAAPLPTGAGATPAPQPIGSGASSAPLPADLPSMLAAFQQFLAAYKQAPNSVPAGSE
ncbi:MAG: hypothetical protein ABSD41_13340 [Candidatus Bathyarchaeia archaeon]